LNKASRACYERSKRFRNLQPQITKKVKFCHA
jgi:hypothetical protein